MGAKKTDEMEFTITGNAFLYHMVRRIVFILVKVGLGEVPVSIIKAGLRDGQTGIVALAPARGLTLVEVLYSKDGEDNSLPGQIAGVYFENGEC